MNVFIHSLKNLFLWKLWPFNVGIHIHLYYIYKKVKNNTATEFEKEALSKYYFVVSLKEKQYIQKLRKN